MTTILHPNLWRDPQRGARLLALACLLLGVLASPVLVFAGGKPELRVAALSLSRGVAHLGETVEATVTIENLGDVGVANVSVRFYLGTRRIGQDFLVDIGPRGRVDVTTAFVAQPEGKQDFLVHVDPNDEISEGDEFNNLASRTLGILSLPSPLKHGKETTIAPASEPARPDLSVQHVTADPNQVTLGGNVRLEARIRNSGDRPLEDVSVRFIAGAVPLGTDRRIALAANQDERVSMQYTPTTAGDLQVAVLVNPDRRIDESNFDNNQKGVRVSVVAPPPKPQPSVAPAQPAPVRPAELPNLVCNVETIDGVHYFDGRSVRIKLRNASESARASPFMLGVRRADEKRRGEWLVTLPVQALAAGEEVTIQVPWPLDNAPAGPQHAYVAVADIGNDVREGSRRDRDNASAPFTLVALGTPPVAESAAAVEVTAPAPATRLVPGRSYGLRWQSTGPVGDKVDLLLIHQRGERRLLAAGAANSGAYDWRAPDLAEGTWWLEVRSPDGVTSGRGGPYEVQRATVVLAEFTAPAIGARVYVGETAAVTWRAQGAAPGARGRLSLFESRNGEPHKLLQAAEVDLASGRFDWRVPAEPFAFGQFRLRLEDESGRKLADSAIFELLPEFVEQARQPNPADVDKRYETDLAITAAEFDGPFLTFTVTNQGPDELSADVVAGIRFRVYFVRRDPPRGEADIGVCERAEWTPLPKGEALRVDIGRDPACAFGERNNDQRFAFAIVRILEPNLIDRLWIDPAPLNNSRRVDWPKN